MSNHPHHHNTSRFGQFVDLTTRLAEILRSYPNTALLKEMLQNADDAGASVFRVCYDQRHHVQPSQASPLHSTPLANMTNFFGPSLLVYNDAEFTEQDLRSIQQIGGSEKKGNLTKTGRFGIGFNSVYHVTDVPTFVSGDVLCLFDPHMCYASHGGAPGMQLDLTNPDELTTYKDIIDLFPSDFEKNARRNSRFGGTMFRLALRTEENVKRSRLSSVVYTHEMINEMIDDFIDSAADCLLFLKSVSKIEIYTIPPSCGGSENKTLLFSASCSVAGSASRAVPIPPRPFTPQNIPQLDFEMNVETCDFRENETKAISSFIVCQGPGDDGRACDLSNSKTAELHKLTLLPWGGVAVPIILNNKTSSPPHLHNPRVFCFLPVFSSVPGLPIHVNGYFELSSNRREIWYDENLSGDAKYRSDWNCALLEDVIASCYVRMLLKTTTTTTTFEWWPDLTHMPQPWLKLGCAVYKRLLHVPCLPGSVERITPSQAILISTECEAEVEGLDLVVNCLRRNGHKVVSVPRHVYNGFGDDIKTLTLELVREFTSTSLDITVAESVALLRFVCSSNHNKNNGDEALFSHAHNCRLFATLSGDVTALSTSTILYATNDDTLLELCRHFPEHGKVKSHVLHPDTSEVLLSHHLFKKQQQQQQQQCLQVLSNLNLLSVIKDELEDSLILSKEMRRTFWEVIATKRIDLEPLLGLKILRSVTGVMHPLGKANSPLIRESVLVEQEPALAVVMKELGCDENYIHEEDMGGEGVVSAPNIAKYLCGHLIDVSVVVKILLSKNTGGAIIIKSQQHATVIKEYFSRHLTQAKTECDSIRLLPLFDKCCAPLLSDETTSRSLPPKEVLDFVMNSTSASATSSLPFLLSVDNENEYQLLSSALGIKCLSMNQFLLQLTTTSSDVAVARLILRSVHRVGLTTLSEQTREALRSAAFVPTLESTTRSSPRSLVDPRVAWMSKLFTISDFPAPELWCEEEDAETILATLVSLGLRQTLGREDFVQVVDSLKEEDHERGRLVFEYFCQHVHTFMPKEQPKGFLRGLVSMITVDDEKQSAAAFFASLRQRRWIPVLNKTSFAEPFPFLPDNMCSTELQAPDKCCVMSAASTCSASYYVVDAETVSSEVIRALDLLAPPISTSLPDETARVTVLLRQLIALSSGDGEDLSTHSAQVTRVTSEIYTLLASASPTIVSSVWSKNQCQSSPQQLPPAIIWLGLKFVRPTHVAFQHALSTAQDLMHVVPETMHCYRKLFQLFGVRQHFEAIDYLELMESLAERSATASLPPDEVEACLHIVRYVADHPCPSFTGTIYLLTESSTLRAANQVMFNDAEWVEGERQQAGHFSLVHPYISHAIAERLGAVSRRRTLIASTVTSFGVDSNNATIQSFGQHEDITSRIRSILHMYPEGASILSELIQNADDAGATHVRVVYDEKQYKTAKTLSEPLSQWQGPAICFFNNAKFTPQDFKHISEIGQGNKLDSIRKTGRFGLGFNAVYHFTDVPSFVSGSDLVMFDPHVRYVPAAQPGAPGMRMNVVSSVPHDFPDQFEPYTFLGWTPGTVFDGTLFRFPLRSASTASESRICNDANYSQDRIHAMLDMFCNVAQEILLFLKSVTTIDVEVHTNDGEMKSLLHVQTHIDEQYQSERGVVSNFVYGPPGSTRSRDDFWHALQDTATSELPSATYRMDVNVVTSSTSSSSSWLICNGLGRGQSRDIAVRSKPSNDNSLRLVPSGGVALRVDAAIAGRVYCFLPLPTETGLPLHINGFFELSADRRTIWHGSDLQGQGEQRAQWNLAVLSDVVAECYLLLALQHRVEDDPYRYFPTAHLPHPWNALVSSFYRGVVDLAVFRSTKKWVSLRDAVLPAKDWMEENDLLLTEVLGLVGLNVISPPPHVAAALRMHCESETHEATPEFVRRHLKRLLSTEDRKQHIEGQLRLLTVEKRLALLHFVLSDLGDLTGAYDALDTLPLVPLPNHTWGVFRVRSANVQNFILCSNADERDMLVSASERLITLPLNSPLMAYFKDPRMCDKMNVSTASPRVIAAELRRASTDVLSKGASSSITPSTLWSFFTRNDCDVQDFADVHMLPTRNGTVEKLTVPPSVVYAPLNWSPDVVSALSKLKLHILDESQLGDDPTQIKAVVQLLLKKAFVVSSLSEALAMALPYPLQSTDVFDLAPITPLERDVIATQLVSTSNPATESSDWVLYCPIFVSQSGDYVPLVGNEDTTKKMFLPPRESLPTSSASTPSLLCFPGILKPRSKMEESYLLKLRQNDDQQTFVLSIAQLYLDFILPHFDGLSEDVQDMAVMYLASKPNAINDLEDVLRTASIFRSAEVTAAQEKGLHRAADLYDPALASVGAISVSLFPAPHLAQDRDTYQFMLRLGLRRTFGQDDVISALSKLESEDQAIGLIQHMANAPPSELQVYIEMLQSPQFDNIAWVPVLTARPEPYHPWCRASIPTPALMPAKRVRPAVESSVCSYCFGLFEGDPKCTQFVRAVARWETTSLPSVIYAHQLIHLGVLFNAFDEDLQHKYRADVESNVIVLYSMLESHLTNKTPSDEDDNEEEQITRLLRNENVIWNGTSFAHTAMCAFSSPLDLTPYLTIVPPKIRKFGSLLEVLGVRQEFVHEDFLHFLQHLARQDTIDGHQLELVCRVADHIAQCEPLISRLGAEIGALVYLPDHNLRMGPARSLCFNDMGWTQERLATQSQHNLVHESIPEPLVKLFRVRSLRAVISEHTESTSTWPRGASIPAFLAAVESSQSKVTPSTVLWSVTQVADALNCSYLGFVLDETQYPCLDVVNPQIGKLHKHPAIVVQFGGGTSVLEARNLELFFSSDNITSLLPCLSKSSGFVPCLSIVSQDELVVIDVNAGKSDGAHMVKCYTTRESFNTTFPHQRLPFQRHFPRAESVSLVMRLPIEIDTNMSEIRKHLTEFSSRVEGYLPLARSLGTVQVSHLSLMQSQVITRLEKTVSKNAYDEYVNGLSQASSIAESATKGWIFGVGSVKVAPFTHTFDVRIHRRVRLVEDVEEQEGKGDSDFVIYRCCGAYGYGDSQQLIHKYNVLPHALVAMPFLKRRTTTAVGQHFGPLRVPRTCTGWVPHVRTNQPNPAMLLRRSTDNEMTLPRVIETWTDACLLGDVVEAYVTGLLSLRNDVVKFNNGMTCESFYALWPTLNGDGAYRRASYAIYDRLTKESVFDATGNGLFRKLSHGRILHYQNRHDNDDVSATTEAIEDENEDKKELIVAARELGIDTFYLPPVVSRAIAQTTEGQSRLLNARAIRDAVKTQQQTSSTGVAAAFTSKPQSVIPILQMAVSDSSAENLKGLALLPVEGTTETCPPVRFGEREVWVGTPQQVHLLRQTHQHQFVSLDALQDTTLKTFFDKVCSNAQLSRTLNIKKFTPEILLRELPRCGVNSSVYYRATLVPATSPQSLDTAWLFEMWHSIVPPLETVGLFDAWALLPLLSGGTCLVSLRHCVLRQRDVDIIRGNDGELGRIISSLNLPVVHPDAEFLLPADDGSEATLSTIAPRLIELISQLSSSIPWDSLLTNDSDYDHLLCFFSSHIAAFGDNDAVMLKLRSLPIYAAHGTSARSPLPRTAWSFDEAHPFFMPTSSNTNTFVLRRPSHLEARVAPLYNKLGVVHKSVEDVWIESTLPRFNSLSSDERRLQFEVLCEAYNNNAENNENFFSRLKTISFVPDNTGALRPPCELLDPRVPFIRDVLPEDASYPSNEFRSEASLQFLTCLGLKGGIDIDVVLRSVKAIHEHRGHTLSENVAQRATLLCDMLHSQMPMLMREARDKSISLTTHLSSSYFIPIAAGLHRYKDVVLEKDACYGDAVRPVLPEKWAPPPTLLEPLGIVSPPSPDVTIAHACALPYEQTSRMFSQSLRLLTRLADLSPSMNSVDIERLRHANIIPITSHHNMAPCLMVKSSMTEDFCPFMAKVDPSLLHNAALQPLWTSLAVEDSVTPEFLDTVQRTALASKRSIVLDVTELTSFVRLVELASSVAAAPVRCLPDYNGVLRPVECCIVGDAPWYLSRIELPSDLHLVHSKVSMSMRKGLPCLSTIVKEELKEDVVLVEGDLREAERLTERIRSNEFANCVVAVLESHGLYALDVEAVHKLFSRYSVRLVQNIETTLTMNGVDVTRDSQAHSFVDEHNKQILVVVDCAGEKENIGVKSVTHLSVRLSALLHCPNLFLEELLRCPTSTSLDHLTEAMHLQTKTRDEVAKSQRGVPGIALLPEDASRAALALHDKSLRCGEIVAWTDSTSVLRYGRVVEIKNILVATGDDVDDATRVVEYTVLVGAGQHRVFPFGALSSLTMTEPQVALEMEKNGELITKTEDNKDNEKGTAMPPPPPPDREALVEAVAGLLERVGVPLSLQQHELLTELTARRRELNTVSQKLQTTTTELRQESARRVNAENALVCPICLDNRVSVALDCGHLLCGDCTAHLELQRCPVCRRAFSQPRQIFLSL
eukprot:PhM_4_TR2050/c0_g1_i1/m.57990/K17592/SACS; sacsin